SKLAYLGAFNGHFAGAATARTMQRNGRDVLALDINRPVKELVDALNAYQPDVLTGYASSLVELAALQEMGAAKISPTYLHSGAEPLGLQDRTAIERAFRVPLLNA